MSAISENIRKFRIHNKMKQSELGELLGKAPSVIANWEAGTNRPDVNSIEKMCEIFNIDANTLFGWEPKVSKLDSISLKEQNIIKKYRALDERGKQTVENTLNHEYELISRDEREKQEDDEKPLYVAFAALGGNGVEHKKITKEQEKRLDEIVKNIKGRDEL